MSPSGTYQSCQQARQDKASRGWGTLLYKCPPTCKAELLVGVPDTWYLQLLSLRHNIPCFSIWGDSRGKWCKGKDVLEYHKYQSSKNIPLKVHNYKYDRNGAASEKDVIVDDPCLVSPFLPRRAGEGAKAGNQYKYTWKNFIIILMQDKYQYSTN